MVFSSTLFLFVFLPVTLGGYYILRWTTHRNYWLLTMSLIFFGWSQPEYLSIILLNIVINYIFARAIDKDQKERKLLLTIAIVLNLAILFYFKYFGFVVGTINMGVNGALPVINIVLPIGISFFTFQGMSYLIDVYRGKVPVQMNILKVGLYIVLFPQLIAGPIVRYPDVAEEIDGRKTTLDDLAYGLERFITGLGKKVIIANTMATVVDSIWNNGLSNLTVGIAWFGSIAYSLQIYFDFSGYSDMAIGLGRMLGFHFGENFNLPYIASSISDFWRRWHISLSSWFRDYVYIPLGGNRNHVYRNLAIVFLLTGIWHGAAWTFILWGIWHGVFILMERRSREKHGSERVNPVVDRIFTLFVVDLGWVIFRAPYITSAVQYMSTMFGMAIVKEPGFTMFWYLDNWSMVVMLLGIFFSTDIPKRIAEVLKKDVGQKTYAVTKYAGLLCVFAFSVVRIVSGTYNPFIYFQF